MKHGIAFLALSTLTLFASPMAFAAATLTPGMYDYTMKMNMPGAPANMPAQTFQRCLGAKDVAGNAAFQSPTSPDSDCKIKDLVQSGSQFSYKMSCTKPEKMDSAVKGTVTATSMMMDMTMTMAGAPGPMTQTMTAKRIGDCKP